MIPYKPIVHSAGFYPISTSYLASVAVLVLTVHNVFSLAQSVVLLGVVAIILILLAAWRDIKSVHTLVNGQKQELKTEIADLKELLRESNVQVPAGPAERRDQTKTPPGLREPT